MSKLVIQFDAIENYLEFTDEDLEKPVTVQHLQAELKGKNYVKVKTKTKEYTIYVNHISFIVLRE